MATYVIYPTNEQEKFMKAFLEALEISFVKDDDDETLPQHVLDGIARGQADIEAGRFITFEEFKNRFPVK
jgi:predicted transcriptional regulator